MKSFTVKIITHKISPASFLIKILKACTMYI